VLIRRIGRLLAHPGRIIRALQTRIPSAADAGTPTAVLAPGPSSGALGLVTVILPVSMISRSRLETVERHVRAAGLSERVEILVQPYGAPEGEDESVPTSTGTVTMAVGPRAESWSSAANHALGVSAGSIVVVLGENLEPRAGWLAGLLRALEPSVEWAQSVVVAPDGLIANAGTVRLTTLSSPTDFLSGHPLEDLPDGDSYETPLISVAAFAARRSALAGFDSGSDLRVAILTASARGAKGVSSVVSTASMVSGPAGLLGEVTRSTLHELRQLVPAPPPVSELYAQSGFRLLGQTSLAAIDREHARRVAPLLARIETRPDRLRWSVRIGAPVTSDGDLWGDRFFADDLAAALRRLGQQVVIDRLDSFARPQSDYLDDVCLTLHGLYSLPLNPTALNVLWVISHPDWVSTDDLESGYGLVFAGSSIWAEKRSSVSRVPVRPLLQATAAERFYPGESDPDLRSDVLFVGRSRNIFRPIVRDSITADLPLSVYGDGWEQFIDAEKYVRAQSLDTALVPAAYRSARFVLNDHWDDMGSEGFFSNRLFDAVASGARVISDPIDGLEELFGSSVKAYRSAEDLARLVNDDRVWPEDDELAVNAAKVREQHSFDNRARVLLDEVLAHRAAGRPND
jgi:hypothetical protein